MSNRPQCNYNSPEWALLEEWMAGALLETYQRLASLSLEEKDTQQLRGRAALLSQMLDFKNLPTTRRP